jgi:uncharacterized membrane protein
MSKGRLEAFSDGVIAIIITIMVLELKAPKGSGLAALSPMVPVFLTYVLSFVYVAIYWNNHHHMLSAVRQVNGRILWANMHLLFWLSLIPFVTAWMGENHFDAVPVALYGTTMLMTGAAYFILARMLIAHEGNDSALAMALGRDYKTVGSLILYVAGIVLSFVSSSSALALYVAVSIMWFIPDRRIEKTSPIERSSG